MQCDNASCNSSACSMMIELQPYKAPPIEPLPDMLHKLKCNTCGGYLSCPPVYETESGKNICGRCPTPKEPSTRSKLYEILAEMVSYPCKFSGFGCEEVIKFLDQKKHDEVCDFRPIPCPITTDGTCDWKGPKGQLYIHCDFNHASRLLHNNTHTIKINANKNTYHVFIMQVLGQLYILYIKVCLISRKIYHSMRFLGNEPDCLYRVDLKKNNAKISKMAKVLPQDDLKFVEDQSMSVNFNSLLDVLGPFDEIYSKVTLYNKCGECGEKIKSLVYHAELNWICMDCVPPVPKSFNLEKTSTESKKQELINKTRRHFLTAPTKKK